MDRKSLGLMSLLLLWSIQTVAMKKDACGIHNPSQDKRILFGDDSEHWPWMAGIFAVPGISQGYFPVFCAASLISSRWLLTAAHCLLLEGQCQSCGKPDLIKKGMELFREFAKNETIKIALGKHDVANMSLSDLWTIQEVYIMEDNNGDPLFGQGYPPIRHDYDVALVKLKKQVKLEAGEVWPICLDDGFFSPGTNCTLLGWGVTGSVDETMLQKIDVPIRTAQYCENWDLHMTDRLLCAGPADPKGNACWGDSGGPLQCSRTVGQDQVWYVTGIVSTGNYSCPPLAPVLYAKTADTEVRQWIKDITGI